MCGLPQETQKASASAVTKTAARLECFSEVFNVYQPLSFPFPGKLHKVPCFADLPSVIADQIVAGADHVLVCPHDGKGLGYVLHPRRVEGGVVFLGKLL